MMTSKIRCAATPPHTPAHRIFVSRRRLCLKTAFHECFFQKPLAKEKTLWRHNVIYANRLQKLAECFFSARTKTPPEKTVHCKSSCVRQSPRRLGLPNTTHFKSISCDSDIVASMGRHGFDSRCRVLRTCPLSPQAKRFLSEFRLSSHFFHVYRRIISMGRRLHHG
jgi:hypothetical protein